MHLTDDEVDKATAAAWNLKANVKWSEVPEEWKPFYRNWARAAILTVVAIKEGNQ